MRRLAVISGVFALAVLAVVLSAPWWLGVALIRFGPAFGLTMGSYERVSYGRFVARDVEYRRSPVIVKVQQVESDSPFLWLWKRATSEPGLVVGGEWSVDVSPSERTTTLNSPRGWQPLQRRLTKIAHHLYSWIPRVEAGKGVVRWPKGELTFSGASWQERKVTVPNLGYRSLHATVTGYFPDDGPIEARATLPDGSADVVVRSDEASLNARGTWWEQPADLIAHFGETGWLPREATFQAINWEVAGQRVKLGKHYALVRGSAVAEWKDGRLNTDVSVDGLPVKNTQAPPLSVKVRGHNDDDAFVAETLDVNLPGISARLSAPVTFDRNGKLRSDPSSFAMAADLSQQPWFKARGHLRGEGEILAGDDGRVVLNFSAGGDDVDVTDIAISSVSTEGSLAWPILNLEYVTVATPDGSKLSGQGGWNFSSRELLNVSVAGQVGREVLAPWLPVYPRFGAVQIEAKAAGPLETAAHEGRADVADLRFQRMNPLRAEVAWKGHGLAVEKFVTEARAGETTVKAEGAADRNRLNLTALSFANGGEMRLQLTKPAELRWGAGVQLSELDLRGPEGALRATVTWGDVGDIAVAAERISSEWFRPLIELPATEWGIDSLDAQGRWNNGPAEFAVSAGVTVHLGRNRAAQISAELKSVSDGVDISALRVAEGGSVIINATGRVPVVIRPAATEKWDLAENAPFSFDAATSANPSFWQEITKLTGIEIVDPVAALHLDGSLNKPRGEVRLSATRLAPTEGKFKGVWPKIENLKLYAVADNERVKLEDFGLSVEGQPVRVSGVLPLKFEDWRELFKDPRAFAQRGEIRVQIPDAEIAAFVHYFPEYIAPKGRFQVDLTFHGEKSVDGFIRLQDGTSRPLGPLGVLQEINADIRFNERTANFQGVTARMGGQVVTLQGRAELLVDQLPQLNLTLTGENLPFVRRSGLLIRGDLDLQLITPEPDRAVIRGVVRLRDSLFLADVRSLLPSGGARGVAARPPYFALETPPLNTWGLDVRVEGERFLRLRTPVFNGTATARFRLSGTLGEPQIAGEAIIDEGNIRLPFASFEVRQGELRLTAGQIEPQIWVAATTRRYGYDLRMELSGNASSPNLVFNSSPPLEAEQVLLMVMAGEAPSNEISTTDRQRVARFGAFFGQSLLGSLGGDPTGPDRLTISSGGDISEQGRETYSIEYKLADRWALTGEYDEFDDYYGGLKWRIYPKKEGKSDE